jgi:hypothetical protein
VAIARIERASIVVSERQRSRAEPQEGRSNMIVPLVDSVTGTPVYINPAYVLSLRPDPADVEHVTLLKLEDGESLRVRGDHTEVAKKLAEPSS